MLLVYLITAENWRKMQLEVKSKTINIKVSRERKNSHRKNNIYIIKLHETNARMCAYMYVRILPCRLV